MEEFVMRKMIEDAHLDGIASVASSATSREEIWGEVGNPVYPPAVRELKNHGIDP
jgi:protein-tyrosine phosphatase